MTDLQRRDLRQLTAAELMTTHIVMIDERRSLRDAVRVMHEAKVRCLLVDADEPGRSLGILTSKDVVQLLGDHPINVLDELTVADAMTRPVVTAQREAGILDCINLMRMTGVRRVPVLERCQLVGLLSYSDVLTYVAQEHCALTA